jgi:hypothetical protein
LIFILFNVKTAYIFITILHGVSSAGIGHTIRGPAFFWLPGIFIRTGLSRNTTGMPGREKNYFVPESQ